LATALVASEQLWLPINSSREEELATSPQAAETTIVRVRLFFSPSARQVQPRHNLCNEALLPQDALVCEERVLAGLRIKGHTSSGVLVILVISDGTNADELRPNFNVIALFCLP
jgi:hypothetical protein